MTAPSITHARLLLVDDDEEACRLLAEVLEREAYDVVPALSADEALTKVSESGPFDAVLTDLRMPGKSGLDLLRTAAGARSRRRWSSCSPRSATPARRARPSGPAPTTSSASRTTSRRCGRPWRARWAGGASPACGATARTPRRLERPRGGPRAGGPQPRDHRGDEDAGPGRAVPGDGAGAGRDRHRQGAGRAHHPPLLRARRPPVRRGELLRAGGGPARERAVRPRAGRVHRRRHRAARPVPRGRPRHAVPRRDRRHLARAAGAPARAPSRSTRSCPWARRRRCGWTCACSRRPIATCRSWCARAASAKTCTIGSTSSP